MRDVKINADNTFTENLKIADLSDRVLLLHKGKIVTIGKPGEIIAKYKEISLLK